MTEPASALAYLRDIIAALYPWTAGLRIGAAGGLRILAAASKLLHLQGDAGDPAAARAGDGTGYWYALYAAGNVQALYWSATPPPLANWTLVVGGVTPPTPLTPGTPTSITSGSAKVTIG